MEELLETLEAKDEVELVFGQDVVCAKCPNVKEGVCVSEEKVARYDAKVSLFCGFVNGQTLYFEEFMQTARKNIINNKRLQEVCADCAWLSICETKIE